MVGGSRCTQREEPTHTWAEHANSTQKGPSRDPNQKPSYCEATVQPHLPKYILETIK